MTWYAPADRVVMCDAADPALDKLLHDQREASFRQSKATRHGVVAPFSMQPTKEPHSPAPGCAYDPAPPSEDDMAAAARFHFYGV